MHPELKSEKFSLFSVMGIEIEYMIVHQDTLEIAPCTDQLFHQIQGDFTNEILRGEVALNNELALHVVELKTNGPKKDVLTIEQAFHHEVKQVNALLEKDGKVLMPTAMHPWTKAKNIKLWPHGDKTIYNTYHRIFNCDGHGWSNLQSTHLNLPFGNEEEFIRLHNAIRVILPLIPALAASSPFCEGKKTGYQCTRLIHYAKNQQKIPSITGKVIPEAIISFDDYHETILNPMYEAISPYDKEKVLQYEWLNSRGAIARFDRDAIEIRIIDSQECPLADMTIQATIIAALKFIMNQSEMFNDRPLDEEYLKAYLDENTKYGLKGAAPNSLYLKHIGLNPKRISHTRDLWDQLIEKSVPSIPTRYQSVLNHILQEGNLAQRLLQSVGKNLSHDSIAQRYSQLISCLEENSLFQ